MNLFVLQSSVVDNVTKQLMGATGSSSRTQAEKLLGKLVDYTNIYIIQIKNKLAGIHPLYCRILKQYQ